jgi:ATP-dependent helicase HrpB
MIEKVRGTARAALACELAAFLDDRDLLRGGAAGDVELASRWHALKRGAAGLEAGARERVLAQARRLQTLAQAREDSAAGEADLGPLLALAYPDRVAERRGHETRRYLLAGGTGAVLPERSMLVRERYLAVGEVDGAGTEVRVLQAAPVTESDIRELFADVIETREEVRWDAAAEAVRAVAVEALGAIPLSERPLPVDDPRIREAMIEWIRATGVENLPWPDAVREFRMRSEWFRSTGLAGAEWPDLNYHRLTESAAEWLGPFLMGVTRKSQLAKADLSGALRSLFSVRQLHSLEAMAPTHLETPAGSRVRLEYSADAPPVLAVRLQEMFGQSGTPAVAGGSVPVRLHLLSPAGRPLAVTQNLVTFWKDAYPEVRKEMRGRYPKHVWPENPAEASPTRKTGKAGKREAEGG